MKAVIISGIAGTAALIAIVGYFFVVPFVETRSSGEGTAIHSEGPSSSDALAKEQEREKQQTEERQEQYMDKLKQAVGARHERWEWLANDKVKFAQPEKISDPEEKIERWETLAAESPNEDLQKDLRNLASWSKVFQEPSINEEERVTAVRSIHRILHDLDMHYNGHDQDPFGVTHVQGGEDVDEVERPS